MPSADQPAPIALPVVFAIAATILLSVSCGPRVNPEGPSTEPTSDAAATTNDKPTVASVPPSREVLIGEMCPAAGNGHPGVMPTFMRRISWDDDADRMTDVLERNMARQFSVLGWHGKRVGLFTAAGAARSAKSGGKTFAMGAYGGGTACETIGADRRPIPECEQAMLSCGLAIGVLRPAGGVGSAPYEEDPEPDTFATGGACVSGKKLVVDVDGDGVLEGFATAAFLNPLRGPADEVNATEVKGKKGCEPRFALRGVVAAGDPRDWRGLDLIGVLDLDGDGRLELIVAYNYQDRRTWAIYSAQTSAGRLDLVAEGEPWARPQSGVAQPVTGADLPKD